MRPSRRTSTRCDSATSSSRSDVLMTSPAPSSAAAEELPVQVGLGSDVHALGRFVQQEDGRLLGNSHFPNRIFCWLPPLKMLRSRLLRGVGWPGAPIAVRTKLVR